MEVYASGLASGFQKLIKSHGDVRKAAQVRGNRLIVIVQWKAVLWETFFFNLKVLAEALFNTNTDHEKYLEALRQYCSEKRLLDAYLVDEDVVSLVKHELRLLQSRSGSRTATSAKKRTPWMQSTKARRERSAKRSTDKNQTKENSRTEVASPHVVDEALQRARTRSLKRYVEARKNAPNREMWRGRVIKG